MIKNDSLNVYGVKAVVYLAYERDQINNLSKKLSNELCTGDFRIETNQEYPYELTGMCETLGFEIWLNESDLIIDYNYELRLQTSMSINEEFYDKMYDISLWLARYISLVCEIESYVNGANVKFKGGKVYSQ